MDFGFSRGAIIAAQKRQGDNRGMGDSCARCGEYINPIENCGLPVAILGRDYYAIPRIPIEEGGKGKDNCVIVCPKCAKEIAQDGTKVIPLDELPYFHGKHLRTQP